MYGGVDFLREVNLGEKPEIGRKVAVVGGGNVAIDVARTAVRLGAEEVCVVYRRSADEMPADPAEVKEAEGEGVKFRYLCAPVEIVGNDGRVAGMSSPTTIAGPRKNGIPITATMRAPTAMTQALPPARPPARPTLPSRVI